MSPTNLLFAGDWVITRSSRVQRYPHDYDGGAFFVLNGFLAQVTGLPQEGSWPTMYPIYVPHSEEHGWLSRRSFVAVLTRHNVSDPDKRLDASGVDWIKMHNDRIYPLAPTTPVKVTPGMSLDSYANRMIHQTYPSTDETLVEGEVGVVLCEENRDHWDGYLVLFETSGLRWVCWWQVVPL